MSLPRSLPRLAVLIDADNCSSRIAKPLFEEIATFGEASVRRIYGDFSSAHLKGWSEILADHAIIPHQNFAHVAGKNASDIALVIDAMDLLHSGRFDGFCLVSSDSDFTRLASRIREQGLDVFGFGKEQTPKSFVNACKRFIHIENLCVDGAVGTAAVSKPAPSRHPPTKAIPLILSALKQMDEDNGWFHLGGVGSRLIALNPEFDSRTYGCAKLSDLVKACGAFEVGGGSGKSIRIRPLHRGKAALTATQASPVAPPVN